MSKAKKEKLRQRLIDTFMGAYGGYFIDPISSDQDLVVEADFEAWLKYVGAINLHMFPGKEWPDYMFFITNLDHFITIDSTIDWIYTNVESYL